MLILPYAKCYAILLMSQLRVKLGRIVLGLKKTSSIEYVKSYWKGSKIYCLSRFAAQNFLRRPTMVTVIFNDFEPPSKKRYASGNGKRDNVRNTYKNRNPYPLNSGLVNVCFNFISVII